MTEAVDNALCTASDEMSFDMRPKADLRVWREPRAFSRRNDSSKQKQRDGGEGRHGRVSRVSESSGSDEFYMY